MFAAVGDHLALKFTPTSQTRVFPLYASLIQLFVAAAS